MIPLVVSFPPWLVTIAICLVFAVLGRGKKDDRIPPTAPWSLPVVGNLFAFISQGHFYYSNISSKLGSPVFSMKLLSQQVYAVTDLRLSNLLHREEKKMHIKETRTVSDRTVNVQVIYQNMFGNSDETINKMVTYDEDGMANEPCYRHDIHGMLQKALAPGRTMTRLYIDNMNVVAKDVREMTLGGPQRVRLLEWMQNVSALSAAAAFYGPENLFASSKDLVRRYWDFESGVAMLMFGFLPTWTAPVAIKAREDLVDEFIKFLTRKVESQEGFSEIVRNRLRINKQYAFSDDANARSEVGMMFAMTASTVPTMFWLIVHILCDQSLHAKVLAEIRDVVVVQKMDRQQGHGQQSSTVQAHLNVKTLKQSCPVLLSAYQENFRTKSSAVMTMRVERDFLFDERYMLNKDALIHSSAYAIHSDPEIWGPDAREFRPERFNSSSSSSSLEPGSKKQPLPSALRPFGAGAEMCPGRYLAMDLILAFTAVVLCTFDITPGNPQKGFKLPKIDTAAAVAIMKPIGDFDVVLSPREDMNGVRWKFDSFI